LASETYEVGDLAAQLALGRRAHDFGSAPRRHLEQPLVAQGPERAEHGVGVDAHDGGEVPSRREPITRLRLAGGDRSSDLRGDLLVKVSGIAAIEIDIEQCAT
jgi:hypothetical protein